MTGSYWKLLEATGKDREGMEGPRQERGMPERRRKRNVVDKMTGMIRAMCDEGERLQVFAYFCPRCGEWMKKRRKSDEPDSEFYKNCPSCKRKADPRPETGGPDER